MYIVHAIFATTLFTILILVVKLPNIDIIYYMRLIMCLCFGFILYIPVISMIIDIFICTEEAKGIVFFDID